MRSMSAVNGQRLKVAMLVVSVFFLTVFLIKHSTTCTIGFVSGYAAAHGLLEGEEVKTYYDNASFGQLVDQVCKGTYDIYSPNPPTYAFMMIPLTVFDYPTAKFVWIIINLLMIFLIVRLVHVNLKIGVVETFLCILLFQPVYANLRFGQNYIFILLMTTLIWVGCKENKMGFVVLGLVLMTAFKLGLIWLWPLLLLLGKWRPVMIAGGILILVFATSVPVIGMEAWSVFLDELAMVSDKESGSVTAYQSVPGFFRHFFTFHPVWNPSPLWQQTFLGGIFYKFLVLGLVAFSLFAARRTKNVDLSIAVVITLSVITSPFTLDYHYPVLILPFLLTYKVLKLGKQKLLLLLAYVAIALPLPYTSDRLSEGFLSVLAYPKLYGAILLMIICFVEMSKISKKQVNAYCA